MKTFLFCVSTLDRWEICSSSSYIVTAESKEEAETIFKMEGGEKKIEVIEEIDLSVKGQVKIQDYIIE